MVVPRRLLARITSYHKGEYFGQETELWEKITIETSFGHSGGQ